jgi:hypothetical protein
LFTNAIEWASYLLNLGAGATRSPLASRGTSLPKRSSRSSRSRPTRALSNDRQEMDVDLLVRDARIVVPD